jgi:bifunctional non-homologous end joining protein LigD
MAFKRKDLTAIGVRAPVPGFIEPALPTAIRKVPSGKRWFHEIKFAGYRVQLQLSQ